MSSMFGPNKYARGGLDDTEWTDLTPLNGWVDYDEPTFGTFAYRRLGGVVYTRGVIKSGATTSNILLAVLPSGFRPEAVIIMPMVSVGAAPGSARIDVYPSGSIVGNSNLSAVYTAVTLAPFIADQ